MIILLIQMNEVKVYMKHAKTQEEKERGTETQGHKKEDNG